MLLSCKINQKISNFKYFYQLFCWIWLYRLIYVTLQRHSAVRSCFTRVRPIICIMELLPQRMTAPFRAETVGSFLKPQALIDAQNQLKKAKLVPKNIIRQSTMLSKNLSNISIQ